MHILIENRIVPIKSLKSIIDILTLNYFHSKISWNIKICIICLNTAELSTPLGGSSYKDDISKIAGQKYGWYHDIEITKLYLY